MRFILLYFLLAIIPYGMLPAQSCNTAITQFPYAESFENGPGGWVNNPNASLDFLPNSGPTPSTNTGPDAAADGVIYYYVDATLPAGYPASAGSAVFESPCYDLTQMINPQLAFDYHMYGTNAVRLFVQLSSDGGQSWSNTLLLVYGDQGNQWNTVVNSLANWSNSRDVRIRFAATVSNSPTDEGDIAIDNIRIEEAAQCVDISVQFQPTVCAGENIGTATLLVYPANTTNLDVSWSTGATNVNSIFNLGAGNYSVTVVDNNANCTRIKNFTINENPPISGELTITPTVAGGANGQILVQASGGTPPYTYQWLDGTTGAQYNNRPAGYTEVKITDDAGCQLTLITFLPEENDCAGSIFSNFPYQQHFESSGLGLWRQGQDDNRNWKRRTGATPTANTGPTSAGEGLYYRHIEASGNGNPTKTATLYTRRCIDITSLSQPEFYFKYHMFGSETGSLLVQLSTDGGATWQESVFAETGDQGDIWKEAFIDLSPFVSSQLRIRVVGRTGFGQLSDIAIDDLRIKSANTPILAADNSPPVVDDADVIISSDNLTTQTNLQLFPNPTADYFRIIGVTQEEPLSVSIFDLNGRLVWQQNKVQPNQEIDLGQLDRGIFIVRIQQIDGTTSTKKLIRK